MFMSNSFRNEFAPHAVRDSLATPSPKNSRASYALCARHRSWAVASKTIAAHGVDGTPGLSGTDDAAAVVQRATGSFRTITGTSGFRCNATTSASTSHFDLCCAEASTAR